MDFCSALRAPEIEPNRGGKGGEKGGDRLTHPHGRGPYSPRPPRVAPTP